MWRLGLPRAKTPGSLSSSSYDPVALFSHQSGYCSVVVLLKKLPVVKALTTWPVQRDVVSRVWNIWLGFQDVSQQTAQWSWVTFNIYGLKAVEDTKCWETGCRWVSISKVGVESMNFILFAAVKDFGLSVSVCFIQLLPQQGTASYFAFWTLSLFLGCEMITQELYGLCLR